MKGVETTRYLDTFARNLIRRPGACATALKDTGAGTMFHSRNGLVSTVGATHSDGAREVMYCVEKNGSKPPGERSDP